MSEQVPREEEPEPARAPVVVVNNAFTYRDLQRGILLTFALILIGHMAEPLTTLLLLFLLVFILAAVLNPIVAWLQARRVPRIVSAIGLVFGVLLLLVGLGWLAAPPLLDEAGKLVASLPTKQDRLVAYYEDLTTRYPLLKQSLPSPDQVLANITPHLNRLLGQVGRYGINIAVGIFSLLLMLVLVIFTVAQPVPLITGLLGATPERYRPSVDSALRRILTQLTNWARGSLVLGLIIGIMTGVGLWSLGLATGKPFPYILLFSVIAGVGEMIPNIGPVLSAVPPVLVALSIDPMLGLFVLILFVVIQQLENNFIVPLVMGQSLNLHPVSVMFTVLVMGVLFGLLGAILAVPVCAIVKVCWEEFYLIPRRTPIEDLQKEAEQIVENGASRRPQDQPASEQSLDKVRGNLGGEPASEPGSEKTDTAASGGEDEAPPQA
jgi:predicted PurR-regulated permease PerM